MVKEGAKIWAGFGSSAEYKLYYQNPVGGVITVTDVTRNSKLESGAVLTQGQKLRIEAAPRLVGSYALKELKVNGEAKASGVEVEVEDKDVLVEALFAKALSLTVTVNPTAVGSDKVVVKDAKTGQVLNEYVAEGQEIEVQVTPVNGYTHKVTVEGADQKQDGSYTVTGAVKVTVTYTPKECTLTVAVDGNANGGATVKVGGTALTLSEGVKGTATVKYGDELTVEPVEVAGYSVEVSPASPITVAGDVNVVVTYTAKETAVESVLLSAATLTPNPASVVVRLSNAEAAKSYAVYTLRGAEVMRGVLAGESVVAIDVTSLADGVYLLRVEAADGARMLGFVVAR